MPPGNSPKVDFRILDRPETPLANYSAGDSILAKGDTANEMYLVRSGRVAIQVNDRTVEEIEAGGVFGEMAVIDHAPRSAAAIALEDTEVIPVNERLFLILVQEAPYFALDIMRVLTDRIRRMNQRL